MLDSMYNKRLLLLGVTILVLGSGWMYPAPEKAPSAGMDDHLPQDVTHLPQTFSDTERLVLSSTLQASLTRPDPRTYLFSELFLATSIGGSNGARFNPKAVSFNK